MKLTLQMKPCRIWTKYIIILHIHSIHQSTHINNTTALLNKFVEFEYASNKFLHRMVVDNYSIFYHIGDNVVTITNVLYNGSDIQTKLKNL